MPRSVNSPSVYNDVRVAVADLLMGALSGVTFLTYTPLDNSLFDRLPAGIVDYDARAPNAWAESGMALEEKLSLLIEIYVPILTTTGQTASDDIATRLAMAENAIKANTYLGATIGAELELVTTKLEALAVQVKQTGVKARMAWMLVRVKLNR